MLMRSASILGMSFVFLVCSIGQASVLVEDFEAAFPAWESGFLGINSNLENYYTVAPTLDNTYRGNNPDGLWLVDDDGINFGDIVEINFSPSFAATLTSLSIDIAGYASATFEIFDASGATLLSTPLTLTFGAETDPGVYANYTANSSNGIGGFRFINALQAEGNISIDNIILNQLDTGAVPEPTSVLVWSLIALMISSKNWRRNLAG